MALQHRRWPYISVLLFVVVIIAVYWVWCWGTPTTVLLIRHADRIAGQDALSSTGQTRAQELVHVLQKASLSAIYHTEAARTEQTAAPLATALGITPVEIPAANTSQLVDDIRTHHYGHTVLVVGHSNTVPEIIAALGGPAVPIIADNEFDNLFVLTLCRCRWWATTKLVTLQYDAVSP